jgi:hypothetical protein
MNYGDWYSKGPWRFVILSWKTMSNMKSFCVNISDSENSKFKFVCYKYFEHFIFHKCVNKGK